MTHILKNKNLEIQIDLPSENYNFSRFDWTGKISTVKFKNRLVSSSELENTSEEHLFGKGFYNEFGIDEAVGFEEAGIGDFFHKIGIGLLKKDSDTYVFNKKYEIIPAKFKVLKEENKIIIECESEKVNGFSYLLKKEIELLKNGFSINYSLNNTGEKLIKTTEYCHNFIAIDNQFIGENYVIKFPFELKPALFGETVNPELKVEIEKHRFTFNNTPNEPFFFSNLSGNEQVQANWELISQKNNIGISETGSFTTNKINLWGWKHVISPELFFEINLTPGKSIEWFRIYKIVDIK